uniref:NADH-ubiquinone oxidoreductase chain 6 n=1 Tax=Spilarctia subcarnea TaxID=1078815 RepID=A0A3G1CVU1_9NEOP|nr:NADH dehydrogenase subunit 6 [Spilarctia subcarnea]
MMKMILSFMFILIPFFMLFLNNPLSMGLLILFQPLFTCLISGLFIKTKWFSMILFFIFLGGVLVVFIYVSSNASNELFMPPFNLESDFIMFFFFLNIFQYLFSNNLIWWNFSFNSDMNNLFLFDLFINNENKINLSKLYNTPTSMIMMMLIIYLFITLIVVVKITNIFYGPFRSKI